MKLYISRSIAGIFSVAMAMGAATGTSLAQESSNQVAVSTAWSVFEEKSPRECWAVAAPSKSGRFSP